MWSKMTLIIFRCLRCRTHIPWYGTMACGQCSWFQCSEIAIQNCGFQCWSTPFPPKGIKMGDNERGRQFHRETDSHLGDGDNGTKSVLWHLSIKDEFCFKLLGLNTPIVYKFGFVWITQNKQVYNKNHTIDFVFTHIQKSRTSYKQLPQIQMYVYGALHI